MRTKLTALSTLRRKEAGFTIVELMLALLILSIVMTLAYQIFTSQEKLFKTHEQVAEMQENLRAVTEFMNQEMSWIGYQVGTVSVAYASSIEIIYRANIPNTGTTLSWVRYRFDRPNHQILRAAGYDLADATNDANLRALASDVDDLAFSFFNVEGNHIHIGNQTPPADWSWAKGSALGGVHDPTLVTIQRIRTNVVVRTSRPDFGYVHPTEGDNYRRRAGLIDVKARNLEDISLSGVGVGIGQCTDVTLSVSSLTYAACPDKLAEASTPAPIPPDLTDNPQVTVTIEKPDGSAETSLEATVSADGGYRIYDNLAQYDNLLHDAGSGEVLYLTAGPQSSVLENTVVTVTASFMNPAEVGCLATSDTEQVQIVSAPASAFAGSLSYSYISLGTGSDLTPQPSPEQLAVCSAVSGEGVRFRAALVDECGNRIEGIASMNFAASTGSFQTGPQDNGDGTYEIVYIPPDGMGVVAPSTTATVTAFFLDGGGDTLEQSKALTLIPARPYDIVVDSITELSGSGQFQFTSTVAPNNGSTFAIERIDGQEVEVKFHLEDACGNRIFGQVSSVNVTATTGALGSLSEDPGTGVISFLWSSNIGCGGAQNGNTLTISASSIANPPTAAETVGFNLLQTQQGVRVIVDVDPPATLEAGHTADSVVVRASVQKYFPGLGDCVNVPGPFPVTFEVVGSNPPRSGSFSPTDFAQTTKTVTAGSDGVAETPLYSGTAQWDDLLTVRATVDVLGATFPPGTNSVGMVASAPGTTPPTDSGMFRDSLYTVRVETANQPVVRAFAPGDDIFVQVQDYDENESPTDIDSTVPPRTRVVLRSVRTGDVETLNLTETGTNTALFRGVQSTEYNPTAVPGDGTLQLRYGDLIRAYYEDKDEPAENETWEAYTTGPSSMRLFKVAGGVETEIIPGPGQINLYYNDQVRPKLFFPQFSADSLAGGATTVTLSISSGTSGDDDVVTLVEYLDTGVFIPNNLPRTVLLTTSSVTDPADRLYIPFTPKTVTVSYPPAASPIEQMSFYMVDRDLPDVSVTTPSPASGEVTVTVSAADTNNPTGAITTLRLYLNGILFDTRAGADLSGDNDFLWSTVYSSPSGTLMPAWLDGIHTFSAEAVDGAGNVRASAPVDVNLANSLQPIRFASPGFGDIFSRNVGVEMRTVNLDTSGLTYTVYLSVDGDDRAVIDLGGGVYYYDLDTAPFEDRPVTLAANIRDSNNNLYTTSLGILVDHTPPMMAIAGTVPTWITASAFPLAPEVTATDANGVETASVVGAFTGQCSSPLDMPFSQVAPDSYRLLPGWTDPACDAKEGILTLTVKAADMASPANTTSITVTTSLDTKLPVIGSLTAAPLRSPAFTIGLQTYRFVRGDVALNATVVDTWPQAGNLTFDFTYDPWYGWPAPFSHGPVGPFDATSGSFGYSWATTSERAPALYWENGLYTVRAFDAQDQAGNLGTNFRTVNLYVDNGVPWVDPPWPMGGGWPLRGTEQLSYWADANYGYLSNIIHWIVPMSAAGNTALAAYTRNLTWPVESKKSWASSSYSWDSAQVTDGEYEGYSRAVDHAGNQAVSGWTSNFTVFNKYMASASAYLNTIGSRWRMAVSGQLRHPNPAFEPVAGEQVILEVSRSSAAGTLIGMMTYWDVLTAPDGSFNFSVPQGDFTYDSGDVATVRFYSDPNWFNYGQLTGTVPGGVGFYRPAADIVNPGCVFTPYLLPRYTLTVTGDIVDDGGSPVPGEANIAISHRDTFNVWHYMSYPVSSDATGHFTFDVPLADFVLESGNYIYIDFYDGDWSWKGYFYGTVPGPLNLYWN